MRCLSILLLGAVAASCTTAPPAPRSAQAEAKLDKLLAGRVAGPSVDCLGHMDARDMIVIDDDTVLFKDGATYYRQDFNGGSCANLGGGGYTMVSNRYGSGVCRGDIARIVDIRNGITVGSCSYGEFVPYRKA